MEGLEKFKEHFSQFSDNYVIIGGTACELTMSGTEVRARATHDIDMIVIVERMTPEFGNQFWNFIKEGGYELGKRKNEDGQKYELYRFIKGKEGYPIMIELLSRHPDILGKPNGLHIEPLPIDENISSLSAIIMDDDFYHFTIRHSTLTDGIRHANAISLIALKAKAYLNLKKAKADGQKVDSRDIKKHRSDIFKNIVILPDAEISAPLSISQCVNKFIDSIRNEWNELAPSLAQSLEQNEEFISDLLDNLSELFIPE